MHLKRPQVENRSEAVQSRNEVVTMSNLSLSINALLSAHRLSLLSASLSKHEVCFSKSRYLLQKLFWMLRSHCLFEKVSATNRSIKFHCRMKVTYCSLYRAENLALHGIPELSSPINNPLDNLAGESYKNYNYSMSCDLIVDLCSERLGISIGLHDISIAHRLRQDIRRNQGVRWSSSSSPPQEYVTKFTEHANLQGFPIMPTQMFTSTYTSLGQT